MSEYKNGLNSMGNVSVGKDDISHDPVTGRAVFIDDDRYDADSAYKAKVDGLIKQGFHKVSEGSGGGSGDFSTAQVTVVNNALGRCDVKGALAIKLGPDTDGTTYLGDANQGSTILKLVLYKGYAQFSIYGPTSSETITVEGSATYNQMTGDYTVTGDCTFTVNPAS